MTSATDTALAGLSALIRLDDAVVDAAQAFAACYEVGEPGREWPSQLPPGAEANTKLKLLNAAIAAREAYCRAVVAS